MTQMTPPPLPYQGALYPDSIRVQLFYIKMEVLQTGERLNNDGAKTKFEWYPKLHVYVESFNAKFNSGIHRGAYIRW